MTCIGGTNLLYLNNHNGDFTKVTQGDPVADLDYHVGMAAADYDNDGNLDLIVTIGWAPGPKRANILYHNNGNGTFTPVSGGNLTTYLGYYGPCAWVDYNNDGFVDLWARAYGTIEGFWQITDPGTNVLWHNDGDGNFV